MSICKLIEFKNTISNLLLLGLFFKEEEGWAKGRINGKEGVFPTNFCVPINESISTSSNSSDVKKSGGVVKNQVVDEKVYV